MNSSDTSIAIPLQKLSIVCVYSGYSFPSHCQNNDVAITFTYAMTVSDSGVQHSTVLGLFVIASISVACSDEQNLRKRSWEECVEKRRSSWNGLEREVIKELILVSSGTSSVL